LFEGTPTRLYSARDIVFAVAARFQLAVIAISPPVAARFQLAVIAARHNCVQDGLLLFLGLVAARSGSINSRAS
jgi:hypothetical protein